MAEDRLDWLLGRT